MSKLAAFLITLLFPFALAPRSAVAAPTSFLLLHSFFDPGTNVQANAQEGYSVALDGDVVVIGAPYADAGAFDAGLVRIYDATTGALRHTLTNPRASVRGYFGRSVGISGTRVVVGAPSLGLLSSPGTLANVGMAYVYDLAGASPTVPMLALTNPTPALADSYATAVAISGTRVVVGMPDSGTLSSGSVYVFDLASANPSLPLVKLTNPMPTADAGFGFAVAISGARVVVGAYAADPGAMDAGSVYVYDVAGGMPTVPVLTLHNPDPGMFDQFGIAVSISGPRVVVGARYDDTAGENTGSAYVYDLARAAPTLPVATLTNPSPAMNDNFGFTVGIDGTRVVVGAAGDNTGALAAGSAYVYELSGPTPALPIVTLNNPAPTDGDYFGFAVAIAGTRIVAGTPNQDRGRPDVGSAYLYDLASPTIAVPVATLASPSPAGLELFGSSVAISGTRLVVGAIFDDTGADNAGSVHVYDLASPTPDDPVLTLHNPSAASSDYFGFPVAISGARIAVGAYLDDTGAGDAGSVYVYDLGGATPGVPVLTLTDPTPEDNDNFGASVSISGARLVVGAPYDNTGAPHAGSAYVYDLTAATPDRPAFTFTNPSPAASFFGHAVAMSGTRVVIGAPYDDTGATDAGVVYVYDTASATPLVPSVTLTNPSPALEDHFGNAVAISGTRVVVGADGDDTGATNAGSVYVYELSSGNPALPVATLTNPSPGLGDWFGSSVAISGTRVVVGEQNDDTVATDAGRVYVYDLADPNRSIPVGVLTSPNPGAGDNFGRAVAIDGTTMVAGAPGDDTNAADRGAAYIFGPPSTQNVPLLSIAPSAPGLVTISWESPASTGLVLQYTDGFTPLHWVTAPSAGANPVTVSATNTSRFYRLAQP